MRKIYLMCILMLMGCDQLVTTSNDKDKNVPIVNSQAAQLAMNYGLIDVSLKKIHRFYSSGNYYNKTDNLPVNGYTYDDPSWYILNDATSIPNTKRIYELFRVNDGKGDHMVSESTVEKGYSSAVLLGKTFTAQDFEIGVFPMIRSVRSWTEGAWPYTKYYMDHKLLKDGEPLYGYKAEGNVGFGWPTYKDRHPSNSVTKDGITLVTSRGWGGAITSLKKQGFFNGRELICSGGYPQGANNGAGRLLQSAFWYGYGDNPTEAGDNYGNGSPVINYGPNFGGTGKIWTRTLGLQFDGSKDLSVNANNPKLTGTEFEKNVHIINAFRIDYSAKVRLAKNAPVSARMPVYEGLAAHLVDQMFDQVRIYYYHKPTSKYINTTGLTWNANEADGDGSQPITIPIENATSAFIVAYDTKSNSAFAIMPLNISYKDATARTKFSIYRCKTNKTSPTSNIHLNEETLKIGYVDEGIPNLTKGKVLTSNSVILIGTLNDVISQANSLLPKVTYTQWNDTRTAPF